MRTLVDLTEAQIRALDELAQAEKRSRAAVIREAIDEFLLRHRKLNEREAFGLWRDLKSDGLNYQEQVRSEW